MRIVTTLVVVLGLLGGCGAPVLRYAPRPNANIVAASSLGMAIAMLLRDPAGWERVVEQAYRDATPIPRSQRVTQIVPSDVLDRLDATVAQRSE